MKDNNKGNLKNESVLKEALLEYEQILKAAKSKLVENNKAELDNLIQNFLKEYENKNEPVLADKKESNKDKIIQESTLVQSPIGEIKEEVSGIAPNAINMKEASLAEVEAAFDNAQPEDDFQVVRDDVSQQSPVMGGVDQQQLPANGSVDNFDLTSIEGEIDEMMKEINQAEQMQAQQQAQQQVQAQPAAEQPSNNPIDRFKQIHEEMGKYLKEIDEMNENQQLMEEFHSKMSEMYGDTYKAQMEESKVNELFDMYKKTKGGAEKAAAPVQEEVAPAIEEKPVDEGHGVALSHNKLAGQEVQPRIEDGKGYAAHKVRLALQKESIEKKMSAMLKENMSLTKKLNGVKGELASAKKSLTESTKKANAVTSLNENYKGALEKYRDQLKEMAVLNTNISYVNNLLVNESFALSQEDKKNIIEKFKKVGSINESEKLYKQSLKEFTETKKETISESIENKIPSTIVESSSAHVIEESMSSNDQVSKMLRLSGITSKKSIM